MFFYQIDLETSLTQLELTDGNELYSVIDANRRHLRQWLGWVDVMRSPADSRSFVQSTMDRHARDGSFQCAIRVQDYIAGVIGYLWIDRTNRITQIGYWLAADYQGRGIMTRACQALTRHAFTALELNRVEIAAAPENRRSCAIAERLGFVEEGLHREAEWLYDRYVDNRTYAMTFGDWQSRSGR